MDDQQLAWAWKNRRRARPTAQAVGPLARAMFEAQLAAGRSTNGRLIAVLEEHAGPELTEHASPVELRRGTLTLEVAEPALLYHVRLAWEQRLIQILRTHLPKAGVHTIRFVLRSGSQ